LKLSASHGGVSLHLGIEEFTIVSELTMEDQHRNERGNYRTNDHDREVHDGTG
jgi:hypothetical protein